MGNILDLLLAKYEIFLLILIRTSGIFVVSPFFSSQNIPNILKVGFSFMLSILLTLSLDIEPNIVETTFTVLVIKELMVGLIIGFISYAFFSTFYVMGQIIDMKIGFGMVNVIDPQHRVQVPLMGNFYYILAFLLFLTINGHHVIINGLIDSYKFISIGGFTFKLDTGFYLVDILSKSFITGFKLSALIVGTIMARTIPQMNVFVVGLPLKILIGLIIIGLSIPIFYSITTGLFNNTVEEIYNFLNSFVKG